MQRLISIILVAAALAAGSSRGTEQTLELQWADLIPRAETPEDPFAKLTSSQIKMISEVAFVRLRQQMGLDDVTAEKQQQADEFTAQLEAQGVAVDDILARRAEMVAKQRAQAESVVDQLNGRDVRIPGFLLPLNYEGEKVTEFLLVPVVGACIHVPPPPPNQMVHVQYEQGFSPSGLYDPVWVSGIIKTEHSTPDLALVDGSAEVNVGYMLQAGQVEPYRR